MKPGPFGHEHPADRAQAILWDYDSYGRLPRHVKALDVGAFTDDRQLISVAPGTRIFRPDPVDGGEPAIISIWNDWPKAEGSGNRIESGR